MKVTLRGVARGVSKAIGATGPLLFARDLFRGYRTLVGIPCFSAETEDPKGGARKVVRVIVNATRPIPAFPFYFECALARALAFETDVQVKVVWDDELLVHWDTVFAEDIRSQKYLQAGGRIYAPKLLKRLRLRNERYSSYMTADMIQSAEQACERVGFGRRVLNEEFIHRGVDIGAHARASTIRFFRTGRVPATDAAWDYFRRSLFNAALVVELANEILRKDDPDVAVTSHGIYSTWGPFYDVFRAADVDVFVYGKSSARRGTVTFLRNFYLQNLSDDQSHFPEVKSLDPVERAAIEEYLRLRFRQEIGDVTGHRDFRRSHDARQERWTIDDPRPFFVLFANLLWDAVVAGHRGPFADPLAWITETVRFFAESPEYRLVIKPHPMEASKLGSQDQLGTLLREEVGSIIDSENILLLQPETMWTAYELMDHADVGLVSSGTPGLEMLCRGIPVIASGAPHYGHLVCTPQTPQAYREAIQNWRSVYDDVEECRDAALSYAHWYFLRAPFDIPWFSENKGEMDLTIVESSNEFHPRNNPTLQAFIKTVLLYEKS